MRETRIEVKLRASGKSRLVTKYIRFEVKHSRSLKRETYNLEGLSRLSIVEGGRLPADVSYLHDSSYPFE